MARRAGRPYMPVSVVTDENWPNYGMFEFRNDRATLHLNIKLLTEDRLRFQALATVLHEGRHFTQHYAANGELTIFDFRARRWQKNMQKYVPSAEDSELYSMQEVERDAQKFALRKMKAWKRKFEKEEDFWLIYENLQKRFTLAEQEAKEKYGKFYKHKIRKRINKRF